MRRRALDSAELSKPDVKPAPIVYRYSVRRVRRLPGGQAILRVKVPGAGDLRIFPTRSVRGVSRRLGSVGVFKLRVRSRGQAHRKLRRKGRTKVRVKLGYRPSGGKLKRHRRWVKLVKRRR